jgi:hypothetical protein
MTAAPNGPGVQSPKLEESRRRIPGAGGFDIVLADSNALVGPDDEGAIVVTGSHGALLGGRADTAVKSRVRAAVYNDAGIGIDARGIAAATVSAWSARIGEAQSSYDDGFVTCVNGTARTLGAEIGISCREFVNRLLESHSGPR